MKAILQGLAEALEPRILVWAALLGGLSFAAPAQPGLDPAPADSAQLIPIDSTVKPPAPPSLAPTRKRPRYPGAPLLLTVPFIDWPHGFASANRSAGFASPSMRQALLWNASATQLAVQSLVWAWDRAPGPVWTRDLGLWLSMGGFSFLFTYMPLGEAWLHEEGHRAVLTLRGAESHNGIYGVEIGAGLIAVDEVEDADLERLKDRHPADFVRLMSAGIEGEVESFRLMRKNNFFLGRSSEQDRFLWWVGGLNVSYYLAACANGWIDQDIAEMEAGETSMGTRDFTGPDFTAWVYDLRRPDEGYAEGPRGRVHPSGTGGFRRYLATSDLTGEEKDYLRLQAMLSLLNFASPQFWGPDWLPGTLPWNGRGVLWNAGLAHHLTPFGYEIAGDVLLRRGKWAWVFTVQALVNSKMPLPGLSAEIFRYPRLVGRKTVYLTAAASAWLQPADLRFDAGDVLPGGSMLAGLSVPLVGGLEAWIEADAKTQGWVAGNVHLDPALQARAGLQLKL